MELHSWPLLPVIQPVAAIAKIDDAHEANQNGAQGGEPRTGCKIARGHLRIGPQSRKLPFCPPASKMSSVHRASFHPRRKGTLSSRRSGGVAQPVSALFP